MIFDFQSARGGCNSSGVNKLNTHTMCVQNDWKLIPSTSQSLTQWKQKHLNFIKKHISRASFFILPLRTPAISWLISFLSLRLSRNYKSPAWWNDLLVISKKKESKVVLYTSFSSYNIFINKLAFVFFDCLVGFC